jgi:signal transduction histidine kinase
MTVKPRRRESLKNARICGTRRVMAHDFQTDIDAIGRIGAVPTILDVVCRTTGMGFAVVARVTEDRWIACHVKDDMAFGPRPGDELKIEGALCRQGGEAVVIDHVAEDENYRTHPTPALYGFQSYISMPITLPDGRFFGALCAIDPKPARLRTPEVVGMFKLFAELIAFHLDAVERVASSEASLRNERDTAQLREELIAVLGHDLRNPLAAIDAGARLLQRAPLDDKASNIVRLIQGAVMQMSGLIDNMLDFARGRLGGGLTLERTSEGSLEPILRQVVADMQAHAPDRTIEARFSLDKPVSADKARIAQMFSNLLGNALTHGSASAPIRTQASIQGEHFELIVANAGDPIARSAMERLFQPFHRGEDQTRQKGLGLGLYIASEIARAHGGALSVDSSAGETRFVFRMPRR